MDDYFDNLDSTEINLKYFTEHHESIYNAYEKYGQVTILFTDKKPSALFFKA